MDKDPSTEELRLEQERRKEDETDAAEVAPTEEDTETHRRRAEKAAYLQEKLEERAEAERD